MTKEEYEKLLRSDYWKGFSYSIIKERNFTCEDCGRRFYNQRNKLQVHHLVYRDINPWSYKPEEMLVLCEDCHKKRHNILSGAALKAASIMSDNEPLNNSFSYSSDSRDVSGSYIDSYKRREADRWGVRYDYRWESERQFKKKYVLYGLFLFVAICFGISKLIISYSNMEKDKVDVSTIPASEIANDKMAVPEALEMPKYEMEERNKKGEVRSKKEEKKRKRDDSRGENKDVKVPEVTIPEIPRNTNANKKSGRELSTLELLERRNHADVVERAKRAGVSTEGSTIEILERINHADVVERAKRAGVSTKGSTIEILERINQAKAAKKAEKKAQEITSDNTEK